MKRPVSVFQACGLDASHFKCWWNVEAVRLRFKRIIGHDVIVETMFLYKVEVRI